MKYIKKVLLAFVMVVLIGSVGVSVLAKNNVDPAESLAKVTNKTVEEVREARNNLEKTYGQIAKDAGKLEAFKLERNQVRKDHIQAKVAEGKISQSEADDFIAQREARQATCDGSGLNQNQEKQGLQIQKHTGNDNENKGQGLTNPEKGNQQRLKDQTCPKLDN